MKNNTNNRTLSKLVMLLCASTELTCEAQRAHDELLRSMDTWQRQA